MKKKVSKFGKIKNQKQILYIFGSLIFIFFIFTPMAALAIPDLLPDCAMSSKDETGSCSTCDFIQLFINLAERTFYLVASISVITIIIGGVTWIISAGNPELVKKGQQIILGTIFGLFFVFSGYLIVNLAIGAALGVKDFSDVKLFPGEYKQYSWNEVCMETRKKVEEVSDDAECTAMSDDKITAACLEQSVCDSKGNAYPEDEARCPGEQVCCAFKGDADFVAEQVNEGYVACQQLTVGSAGQVSGCGDPGNCGINGVGVDIDDQMPVTSDSCPDTYSCCMFTAEQLEDNPELRNYFQFGE